MEKNVTQHEHRDEEGSLPLDTEQAADFSQYIPEPLIDTDKRWKITFQRKDVNRSIRVPVFVPVLFVLAVLFMLVSAIIVLINMGNAGNSTDLTKLQAENGKLRQKLEYFEAQVDSIYQKLNQTEPLDPEADSPRDFPYVPAHSKNVNKKNSLSLENRYQRLDSKINIILTILDGEDPVLAMMPVVPPPQSGDGIPSIYPTFGAFSSGFGVRLHPILEDYYMHTGVDISNEIGTPIYATADGVVRHVGFESGFGKRIFITHQGGYETHYAHLDSYQVKEGDEVYKGQIIGLMGNTGLSTGPHLHYEVIKDGDKLNPIPYLNRIDTTTYAGR